MFEIDINTLILELNGCFNSNLLLLHLEKPYFIQFLTKTLMQHTYTYHMKRNKYPVYIAKNVGDC